MDSTVIIIIIVAVAVCLLCVSSSIGGGIFYSTTITNTTTPNPTTGTTRTTAPPTSTPKHARAIWHCMGPNNTRFDNIKDEGKDGIVRLIDWTPDSDNGTNFCSVNVSDCGNYGPCTLKKVSTY